MRTNEERIRLIHERTAEIRKEQKTDADSCEPQSAWQPVCFLWSASAS